MSDHINRFLVSGTTITLCSMVCFYLLAHFLGSTPYYSMACGALYFIISALNFLAQKIWVFSSSGKFINFLIINSFLAVVFLGMQYFFAKIYGGEVNGLVGVVFYLIVSFFMFPLSFYFNKKVFGCD